MQQCAGYIAVYSMRIMTLVNKLYWWFYCEVDEYQCSFNKSLAFFTSDFYTYTLTLTAFCLKVGFVYLHETAICASTYA